MEQYVKDYTEAMLQIPEGAESGIFQLFYMKHYPKLEAKVSIEATYMLKDELEFPIIFVFGDQDWMDPKGAYRLK